MTARTQTVLIPAEVKNGRFEYFYGGPLPPFREGTVVEMRVNPDNITDGRFLADLQRRQFGRLLDGGETVYVAVSAASIPAVLADKALPVSSIVRGQANAGVGYKLGMVRLVKVDLLQPLFMEVIGAKMGRLKPALCHIPGIGADAVSLSHAYRLISERFEPERISHSGNVYQKVVHVGPDSRCRLLESLRAQLENISDANLRRS